jgi:myosin heavy subunit
MFNFDSEGFVMGGRVTEFLLEKSRVTAQADGERNYHIFYQLVEGLNPTLADLFEMHDVADFDYLNATESEVEGLDDKEDFESTQAAMDAIGMYPEEQEEVMRVVASVLHLGNMDFSASADGESCHVSDPASALAAARLLGVDATDLGEALNSLVRMLPTGTVISPVTSAQARSSRDALAKMVYARLFNWVIRRINSAFDRDASNVASFIGVLDIFGFENMKSNKFEQLFINYTNEQLQYLFNETVFKQEEEEYQREQIQWDKTAFPDNTSCIELLSKKPLGLLPFMDSECSRGAAASDEGLVSKWHKTHKSHPNYEVCGPDTVWRRHDGSFTENTDFLIKHFAGPVIYSCQKFIEKNQDAFYDHIYDIVADSSSPLVQALFPTREADQSSQEKTVSARFVNQMRELVNTLQSTEIRFVRCIKSNDQLKPQLIDKANVLRQLVCSGVTAALEVRRAGYPSRVLYHEFVRRFRVFDTGSRPIEDLRASRDHAQIELALSRAQHGDRETTARMMTHPSVLAKVSGDQYRLGLTKLFLQADVLQILERIRNTILLPYVIRIQRWWMRSKSNYLQHALNRAVSKLSSIISRAKLGRIQHQAVVRYALEEAAAAARYAKGLGLVAPDMSKNVLLTLQTKNELAEKAVEEAINAKEAAARERAALLEQLDSGVIRLRTVDRQTPELQRQARLVELTQMVVRASRAIESCRTALIRAASQADLSSGPEASTKHSSVLKRSFTKAMLIVSRDDDDGQSTTAGTAVDVEQDLSSHEDEVSAAMEMVEQAEQLCQQLLNDKYRVDQARAAYTSNLAVTRSTLEHSFRKADETGVTGSVIVQHTFNAAREALEYADKCLDGNDQGLFESSVQRAAECVDEASSVVEKEAEFRTQELARNRANSILQLSQKKYRQVLADAELYGVQDMPTFSRCAALAEDALNATALLDEGDGLAFEAAAEHAQAKVNNLVEACTAEKQLKSRLDTEKREELRKLEPAVGNLAALKTKLEFAGVNDDKVRQAVEDAQFAIERARDAIRKTDCKYAA